MPSHHGKPMKKIKPLSDYKVEFFTNTTNHTFFTYYSVSLCQYFSKFLKGVRVLSLRIGVFPQSKFSKNLNMMKVIEGKSGLEATTRYIYDLAKLCKAYLKTKKDSRAFNHRQLFIECSYHFS